MKYTGKLNNSNSPIYTYNEINNWLATEWEKSNEKKGELISSPLFFIFLQKVHQNALSSEPISPNFCFCEDRTAAFLL